MKIDFGNTASQIVLQSVRTLVTLILIGGTAVFFVEHGTGALSYTLDNLATAHDLLINLTV